MSNHQRHGHRNDGKRHHLRAQIRCGWQPIRVSAYPSGALVLVVARTRDSLIKSLVFACNRLGVNLTSSDQFRSMGYRWVVNRKASR